jgi:hypothetical protein
MTTQLKQALEIAKSNADMAVDNFGSRDYLDTKGRDGSISAHADNVVDTLKEQGLEEFNRKALAAFYKSVAKQLAK